MNNVADGNCKPVGKNVALGLGLSRVTLSVALAAGVLALSVSLSAGQDDSGAWFTAEQAARGNAVFVTECGGCHGYSMAQIFAESETAEDFYAYISSNMPWENPGALASQQYADIVAFFLGELAFPAGDTELPPDRQIMAQIDPSDAGAVQVDSAPESADPEPGTAAQNEPADSEDTTPDDTVESEAASEGSTTEGQVAPTPGEANGAFYTAEQAEQGRRDFTISCGGCHGGEMVDDFQSYETAADFHDFISSAMPVDAPGSLAPAQYTAIVAYLLGESGFPAGETELTDDTEILSQIVPGEAPQD